VVILAYKASTASKALLKVLQLYWSVIAKSEFWVQEQKQKV